uniref:Uncharacterized protein n=1 Tax=Phlebotomus papatasi TaxID=29031 RepID=A0A3F2ZEF2_PHLPP
MPSRSHLEMFDKIKPKLELGISISSFWASNPSNESRGERFLIKGPFISTTLISIFAITYMVNTFEGRLTTNLALSFLCCFGSLQICSKTLSMRYHRDKLIKLLNKAEFLHNNFENEELSTIGERNLKKFSDIWLIFCKIGTTSYLVAILLFSLTNALKGKLGIIFQIPLVPIDLPYYTEIMLFVQFILVIFGCISIIFTELGVAYHGFQIMAASDILFDYISINKDKIQECPDFLKIITIRYCDIVENINLLKSVISFSVLVQFVFSAFMSLAIFF